MKNRHCIVVRTCRTISLRRLHMKSTSINKTQSSQSQSASGEENETLRRSIVMTTNAMVVMPC